MNKWVSIVCTVMLATTYLLFMSGQVYGAKLDLPPAKDDPSWQQTVSAVQGADVQLAHAAHAAVLMEADTGTIIFEKNSHAHFPPASITKIMTMLLTMEAIERGKLSWQDKVTTSEYAASMGGSQIFLEVGEEMTVADMMKGIAMASGNDASVAMAEKIAGTEQAFVRMMNEKAQQLGMKHTRFANCNGLPAEHHYTSAYDIALMSQALLKYKHITKYTGVYEDYLRQNTNKKFWLVNTNKLVRFYQGADGLKTGFTTAAKYCLSATAQRDNMRVIAVVLGEPNTKTRNTEVSQMFDYAFAQYTNVPILKAGDVIGTVQIEKGAKEQLKLKALHPYHVLLKKDEATAKLRFVLQVPTPCKAPIHVGQPLGKMVVYQGNQVVRNYVVKATEAVAKAGWWTLCKRVCSQLFFVT